MSRSLLFVKNESNTKVNIINLSERLSFEKRIGWEGSKRGDTHNSNSVLILIENTTSALSHWKSLNPTRLGDFGIYNVWRVDRFRLQEIADNFKKEYNLKSSWERYNPDRC